MSSLTDGDTGKTLPASSSSNEFEDNSLRRHSFRKDYSNNLNKPSSLMNIEEEILNSDVPMHTNETEEVDVLGYRGVLLNKNEILNWNKRFPVSPYKLNYDPDPKVIHKHLNQPTEYTQDIQVKYLKPPTPPPPGLVSLLSLFIRVYSNIFIFIFEIIKET